MRDVPLEVSPGTESRLPLESAGPSRSTAALLIALGAVLAVFAYTVWIRAPYIERPVSWIRHGEGTARVLRHMRVWDEAGLARTHFMMRTTGTAPADRFIADVGYLTSGDGVFYYASFPPLFPLAPYLAFRALSVSPSPEAIRTFNLGLHAIGALLLFALARRALRERGEAFASSAGVFAAAVYLISPGAMWYHSNAYVSASLSTPLLIACTYLGLRAAADDRPSAWLLPALGATAFALAYADWVGVTLVAAIAATAAWYRRDRRLWMVAAVAAAGTIAALLLTAVQYSSVAGVHEFVAALGGKFEMRTGLSAASHHSLTSLASWKYLLGVSVRKSLEPELVFLGVLAVLFAAGILGRVIARRPTDLRATFPRAFLIALAFLGGASLLHHLILFSHTVIHDFDLLKDAAPLGLLVGVLAAEIGEWGTHRASRIGTLVALAVVLALGARSALPKTMKRDFTISWGAVGVGEAIAEANVGPNEAVFLKGPPSFYIGSSTVHYAGRNIARYHSREHAAKIIRASGASGGVLFVLDEAGRKVARVDRVAPDGSIH